MSKLLVLANLEFSFSFPDGIQDAELFARRKERRLLRLLERLASEDLNADGALERLEFESFSYQNQLGGDPKSYYYNKHDKRAETP